MEDLIHQWCQTTNAEIIGVWEVSKDLMLWKRTLIFAQRNNTCVYVTFWSKMPRTSKNETHTFLWGQWPWGVFKWQFGNWQSNGVKHDEAQCVTSQGRAICRVPSAQFVMRWHLLQWKLSFLWTLVLCWLVVWKRCYNVDGYWWFIGCISESLQHDFWLWGPTDRSFQWRTSQIFFFFCGGRESAFATPFMGPLRIFSGPGGVPTISFHITIGFDSGLKVNHY